ncbi:DUF397 domain-containing protein [Streptomyces sp. NPDC051322]|uniref:DUF397 domain-containing protein n=1 Tax=Streptomyces sp. NPDC051322 TaxID=3154645 RepID=UPI00344C6038
MASVTPATAGQNWFKSSYSGGNQTECVEAACILTGTAVRDSKNPHGPQLAFSSSAWTGFVSALRTGQLD